jgi:ribose transport system ATP-binding protein
MLSMSDHVIIISEGKITAEYDKSEATQAKLLHAATI